MARPTEAGLEYFSMPLDLWSWDELHFVIAKHKHLAKAVIIDLLRELFNVGYCYRWGYRERVIFADRNGYTVEDVEAVVTDALNEGFFNKKLFESCEVLSSEWIQTMYESATSKRRSVKWKREYLLITPENSNAVVKGELTRVNVPHEEQKLGFQEEETTQSKVKESKVKESKGEEALAREICSKQFSETKNEIPETQFETVGEFARISKLSRDLLEASNGKATVQRALEIVNGWVAEARGNPNEFPTRRNKALNADGVLSKWALSQARSQIAQEERSKGSDKKAIEQATKPAPAKRKILTTPSEALDIVRNLSAFDESEAFKLMPIDIAETVKKVGWKKLKDEDLQIYSPAEKEFVTIYPQIQRQFLNNPEAHGHK